LNEPFHPERLSIIVGNSFETVYLLKKKVTITVKRETVYPRNVDISMKYLPTAIRRCRGRTAISLHSTRRKTSTSVEVCLL